MNNCKECSSSFKPKTGSTGLFCSKSCSARFNNRGRTKSTETRNKTSKTMSGRTGRNGKTWCDIFLSKCLVCSKSFYTPTYRKRKTCGSSECKATASVNRTSKIGSTNSIYWDHPTQGRLRFDSSWEESIAKFLDQQAIEWIRPQSGIKWVDSKGVEHHYFPDFYLPKYDLYLDPKNDKVIHKDQEKLEKVQQVITLRYGTPQQLIDELNNWSG